MRAPATCAIPGPPWARKNILHEVEARRYRIEPHNVTFADFPKWAGKRSWRSAVASERTP